MRNWRWWLLGFLTTAPFLFLMGYGLYQLWATGWLYWAWWPMTACLVVAFILAWRWQRGRRLLDLDSTPSLHWTERDREAWQLVVARAEQATSISTSQLTSLDFYVAQSRSLAEELALFYHPGAKDPLHTLTLVEILGVAELATHDLAVMLEKYVPGSHMFTVDHWRKAQQALGWYQTASNAGWLAAAALNPVATGLRYAATRIGFKPWRLFRDNMQLWFYQAFVQRVGSYLIELYGGRLRRGATRYRQLFGAAPNGPPLEAELAERPITIAVVGRVSAGKSSVINALVGENRARTGMVKTTDEITRYELQDEEKAGIVFLDTVGYAHEGPRPDQLRATEKAAREADILLLVLHARDPARQADLDLLRALGRYFADNPELKKPPTLAVLTHVDLLPPAMEWSPPYDWLKGVRPKEKSIAEAATAAQEQLGDFVLGVAPVCAAAGKEFGVNEMLLPAITTLLEEGRAVALVRILKAEADTGNLKKTFDQLLSAGGELFKAWWRSTTS